MPHTKIIILFLIQSFSLIFGKDCLISQDDSTSVICSETGHIIHDLTNYLSNFSNLTQLSLVHSYLTEMPDFHDSINQLKTLHLDYNLIGLINQNYSTVESLYLTFNHIYALHQTNLSYPKLKLFDLSHNPIEHIAKNFFSDQQFPQLQILKLTDALKHINPYIIDDRLISFSSLKYLNELYLDENDFEEFICSENATHIQWKLSTNLKKISFERNKLLSFDQICFSQISNIVDLNFHSNHLTNFSKFNSILPSLSKLRLDSNLFTSVPSILLHSSKQLTELDLSANQLNLKIIKTTKQSIFPTSLKILYLNSTVSDLSCSLFENLNELEQLYLVNLTTNRLKNCIFKKLIKLKTLNLSNHHLNIFDEQVFRPLLTLNQLDVLDITSHSLHCESCSLRWLIQFLKHHNKTHVTCLDQHGKQVLLNTLDLSSCPSSYLSSIMIILISISIVLLVFILLFIYTCQYRKFSFAKSYPVYRMIPLQHRDRIYQSTTEDIINDDVMLVT